jgi:cell division protein FtsZ
MTELLTFDAPKQRASIIKVLGVGGGGSNAVTHMYQQGIRGVDFIICNTDAQAMDISPVPNKVQLGTKGLGAGAIPEVGRVSAEENIEEIKQYLESNTKMLFITAGMGGGTGTGAAPVIAKLARDMGILTVAIVTLPFAFEGNKRRLQAEKGIEELKKAVDTLLIISNEKLREIHGNLRLSEAFGKADDILTVAAKGIAEIITVTGYINVDFEDVKTVMKDSGTAIMGSATAEGEDRARTAVNEALSSPLLNDNKIKGASDILLYISSGKEEITFDEVTEITEFIQKEAGKTAEVIWGNGFDESLGDKISITLIATGFTSPDDIEEVTFNREKKKTVYTLSDELPDKNSTTTEKREIETDNQIESNSDEEITEITLIKKERPATDGTVGNFGKEAHSNTPSLFDSENSRQQEPSSTESIKQTSGNITGNNGKLRVKYTVGENHKPAEDNSKNAADENQLMQRKADDRVKRLKELNFLYDKNDRDIEELIHEPAFRRKKVQLNPVISSSESNVARYVLGSDKDEKDAGLKDNDIPYINNKPD